MQHPKLQAWENKLRGIFNEIDDHLESAYGHLYPLHPARARRRATGNKEHDGLFQLGTAFSAGFGSKHGPGYIIKIEMITLANVPDNVRAKIENDTIELLNQKLPAAFPNTNLKAERDGQAYKIYGDLNLDNA